MTKTNKKCQKGREAERKKTGSTGEVERERGVGWT